MTTDVKEVFGRGNVQLSANLDEFDWWDGLILER